ncbi:hypothetical protein [Nocardia sp. CA-290969]|uniref:hypothetical protein n=1 Tax=Nocardia sp. CA-290969 TaxID=3239986 RepID=UPI003D92755A
MFAALLIATGPVMIGIAATSGQAWWAVPLTALATLLLVFIGLGMWFSPVQRLEDTAALHASGRAARAELIAAEEVGDEDTVYLLTLRIVAQGSEPVEVSHRCRKEICRRLGVQGPPGELAALIDPESRTWAITHR